MKHFLKRAAAAAVSLALLAGMIPMAGAASGGVEARLASMTLREKVGQARTSCCCPPESGTPSALG